MRYWINIQEKFDVDEILRVTNEKRE